MWPPVHPQHNITNNHDNCEIDDDNRDNRNNSHNHHQQPRYNHPQLREGGGKENGPGTAGRTMRQ